MEQTLPLARVRAAAILSADALSTRPRSRSNATMSRVTSRAFTNGLTTGALGTNQRQKTILIAEDDAVLLSGVTRLLSDTGYRCYSAHNGQEALDVFHSFNGDVDLFVCDVFMPVLDGISAWRRMRRVNPQVRCIIMSGEYDGELAMHFGPDAFLQKPFEPVDLLVRVRDVLAGALA